MINLFQQRDFGDKINATFQYITQNFRSLALSLLYIVGPVALLAGIASGIFQSNLFDMASDPTTVPVSPSNDPMAVLRVFNNVFSPAFWMTIFFGLLAALAVSLVTYAHMKVYAKKSGAAIEVTDVWEEMQPVIGRGIIISLLGSVITAIGFLFFVIPGVYLVVVLVLALAITTFEGTDFGQTLSRCFTLIRDNWWATFGLVIVMGLISGIVGLVFTAPAAIINFLVLGKLLPDLSGFWIVLGNVLSTVGGTLLRSLIYVAIGFQYANLVEEKEGRGLISSIDSIGTVAPRSGPNQPGTPDEDAY